ncbi:hypothetical protein ACFW6E_37605 [Streptomyces olivaceoviridis]|uniref:hypothetical protein n=1 Tax=Streptomyces olivaceoviridis TaxID=1921 RepID=UPI0036D20886
MTTGDPLGELSAIPGYLPLTRGRLAREWAAKRSQDNIEVMRLSGRPRNSQNLIV